MGINMSEQGLTQDAMPLKRSSLGEIGYDAHAVPSLPTIIAAEIWITTMKAQLKYRMVNEPCLSCSKRLWYFQHVQGSTLLLLDAWSQRKGWCSGLWRWMPFFGESDSKIMLYVFVSMPKCRLNWTILISSLHLSLCNDPLSGLRLNIIA